jgi:hypothetical protein
MNHNSKQVFATSIKKLGEMRLIQPPPPHPKAKFHTYALNSHYVCLLNNFDILKEKR